MKRFNTIIWDMDGTLLDTLDDLMVSVNNAMQAFGLPEKTRTEIRCSVGNGITRLMELTIPGGRSHERFEEISAHFLAHYSNNSRNKTKLYDGLDAVLAACVENGIKMGIVSNKGDAIVKELAKLYFHDTIPVAIGAREGMRMKPEPDTVFEAMRELGAQKESTVYIGDSEVDVKTAQNAGLFCIAVDWGFRDYEVLKEAGADVILHTPMELAEYLGIG